MLLLLLPAVVALLKYANTASSDDPCSDGWTYSTISGKCYLLTGAASMDAAVAACRSVFPFPAYRNKISLTKIQDGNDVRGASKVMIFFDNRADIWIDAMRNATTNIYTWSDGSIFQPSLLSENTEVANNLSGPCFHFRYSFSLDNQRQYVIKYQTFSVSCSSSFIAMCEHKALACDLDSIRGFDGAGMEVVPNNGFIQNKPRVACKFGFYRDSELTGFPTPSTSDPIPANYLNCTGTRHSTGNPFQFLPVWILNSNQRFIEACKRVSCPALNGTLENVQKENTFPQDSTRTNYPFGFSVAVMCKRGFVSFKDVTKANSSMTCIQSSFNKKIGVWSPENYVPCLPVKCNLTQLLEFQPIRGKLASARNKINQRQYDVNFQQSSLPYYDNIVTLRCNDGFFYPDRSYEKQVICGLQKDSLILGEWLGYLGTVMPVPSSCDVVTCKYEEVVIQPGTNLQSYWFEMNDIGVYINVTQQKGEAYKYKTKLRFFCENSFDTANETPDQNITCGPQGSWVPRLTMCIKKTDSLQIGNKKRYVPPAVDAPAAREVGYVAIVILVIFLTVIVILDLSTLTRDIKILRNNVHHLKEYFRKRKLNKLKETEKNQ